MIGLPLLLAGLVAGQGQALEIIYPTEAGLTDVAVQWSGHSVPFVQSGDHWVTTVGVDLDSRAGTHAVDVTFRYADGHTRLFEDDIVAQTIVEGILENMRGEELRALAGLDETAYESKRRLIRRRLEKRKGVKP